MDLLEAKNAALSYLKTSNAEIMKWFRADIAVEFKSDQSPVTVADRKAEEILRKKISRSYPDHGIIGEEFGEGKSKAEWVWTIDPIDGTRSFIRGLPLFASLIVLHRKPASRAWVRGNMCFVKNLQEETLKILRLCVNLKKPATAKN